MSAVRKIYIPVLLGVLAYLAFFFYEANQVAGGLFERQGPFKEQPSFKILNFDATDVLVRRLTYLQSQTEWFRNMFSDLNGFAERTEYQSIPVFIVGKVGEQTLRFDPFFARKAVIPEDPRFSIRSEQLRYAGGAAEQNDCRDELAKQGKQLSFNAVAPFSAVGIVQPPVKCHLFLRVREDHASLEEIYDLSRQLNDWRGIVYYVPKAVYFIFEDARGATISSLNNYLDQSIPVSLFDAFSIDASNCANFQNCVAGQLQSLTLETGETLAGSLTKSDLVRTDFLQSDQNYLVAELKPTSKLKRAELIFRMEPIEIRIDRIVSKFTSAHLDKLRQFKFDVSLDDADLYQSSFVFARWLRKLETTEIGISGAKVNVLFAGVLLIALAVLDLLVLVLRPKRSVPATSAGSPSEETEKSDE